jgi:hypothetical protein
MIEGCGAKAGLSLPHNHTVNINLFVAYSI